MLDEDSVTIEEQREALRIACQSPEGSRAECEAALQDLSEALKEFSSDIDAATTSASTSGSMEANTTTR